MSRSSIREQKEAPVFPNIADFMQQKVINSYYGAIVILIGDDCGPGLFNTEEFHEFSPQLRFEISSLNILKLKRYFIPHDYTL